MRSALLCVFFTLIIRRETIHAQNDDFRPTPIPLIEWHYDRRDGRAGTLHETFKTASPPTVAAVPAHYWEDALRHSVYLTLVRDKIDQLIAKGDIKSPNSKPNGYDSKEIDDHDLWDKIKTAPFDRIPEEELVSLGDVTIMAKGRLLEQNEGFRFAEDERTKEKCSADNCMQNVKAFWSVKRVRQRDLETSPGKYHYELTFSVISQTPKKQRKPYENPIRTFTVKESSPIEVTERQVHTSRPQRAIWVHKNIAPSKFVGRKQYFPGLDRIFSSFFSDDDDRSYESPLTKYKQSPYPPPSGSQYSKIGQVGIPNDQHPQIPYPYRPQPSQVKLIRPPLQAPPTSSNQYQYQDFASITTTNSNPYAHYPYDHRVESNQIVKTTRPAVLPTPLPPILPPKDQSAEVTNTMPMEQNNGTLSDIKTHKIYNKYKNTPVKVSYFSDHVRPPVFNAPPGVFVTMDKKPFKPMPPLKMMHSKQHRTNKPIDFRPSPQILDQPIDPDSFSDTAFRPITMKYSDNTSTEKDELTAYRKNENKIRKTTTSSKKPFKKHENVKSNIRITTSTPDIITASSSAEEIETMDWANVLGSFTKTTPMASQTEKIIMPETTTPMTTTTTIIPVTTPKKKLITTTEPVLENVISTTVKPKRRTRPPPKFVKQDKIKKHKRITTTTTTSTTTTNAPENSIKRRPIHDLTPLASSAATGTIKFSREPNNKTTSTTTTTTTTTTTVPTTTTKPITIKTTTTQEPSTTTTIKPIISTMQSKSKNRFRQSTLMYKGTSVKHDRWSVTGMSKNQTGMTSQSPPTSLHRRKGSNFQGYISSTTPRYIDEEKEQESENHIDRKIISNTEKVAITSEINLETDSPDEESESQYESNSVLPLEKSEENNDDKRNDDDSKDHSEYIFQPTTTASTKIEENSTPKNKSKCKKKKQNPSTTEDSTVIDFETPKTTTLATVVTTTEKTSTENDILENFFNYNFSEDDKTPRTELEEEESLNHESYSKIDDDIEDFLGVLNDGKSDKESEEDQYDDEDEDDVNEDDTEDDSDEYEDSKIPSIDDDAEFDSVEDSRETSREAHYNNDPKDRPYSFLELMAMS